MHILFLTDNFPPEVNAPASRTFEHCREWTQAGHQVTVITCVPNFPKGCIFPGYRNKLWQSEMMCGMRVVRVWSYVTANEGFARRIVDYLSYLPSAVLASLFVRRPDVVIGTSPQFFTACAAYLVGRLKRIPWVFELRDLWPESIRAVGAMKNSRALDLLEWLELFLYRKASAIVSVTHAFRHTLISRGIDGSKIHVVTNGVDLARFHPQPKDAQLSKRLNLAGKFVVGYIGTHGMAHALDTVLDAARRLRNSSDGDKYVFLMLGDGASKQRLMERAALEGLDNVLFINSVCKEEVVHYWSLLDAAIIHLKRAELFSAVIPSKLFECMAMGIPVLHGVKGESAGIVEREDVGLVFEPENDEALCIALRQLASAGPEAQRMKKNGPVAAERYDRAALAQTMLEILDTTVRAADSEHEPPAGRKPTLASAPAEGDPVRESKNAPLREIK